MKQDRSYVDPSRPAEFGTSRILRALHHEIRHIETRSSRLNRNWTSTEVLDYIVTVLAEEYGIQVTPAYVRRVLIEGLQ